MVNSLLDRLRRVSLPGRPLPTVLRLAPLLLVPVLLAPPLRAFAEATMGRQMLVQMPLVVLAGWCAGSAWLRAPAASRIGRIRSVVDSFNAAGATGLVVASFTMVLWMLPRSLDAARLDVGADAVKLVTLALGLGLPAALSWPRCPAVVRVLIHAEVTATLIRFGWGYAASDERLCSAYLQGDQQLAGVLLVAAGLVWALTTAWKPLFGGYTVPSARTWGDRSGRPIG